MCIKKKNTYHITIISSMTIIVVVFILIRLTFPYVHKYVYVFIPDYYYQNYKFLLLIF